MKATISAEITNGYLDGGNVKIVMSDGMTEVYINGERMDNALSATITLTPDGSSLDLELDLLTEASDI